jgi:hypothetical protein
LKDGRRSSVELEESRRRSSGRFSFPSVIVVIYEQQELAQNRYAQRISIQMREQIKQIEIGRVEIAEREKGIARVWDFADRERGN